MTNWYKDIFPCSACENSPIAFNGCRKNHKTIYVEGCSKCGVRVSAKWYYFDEKCPDFEHIVTRDPSGS